MKEDFKKFVKANPKLITYVKDNNASWQSLYEVYALYGEDPDIWDKYVTSKNDSIEELIKMVKKINLESVKSTVDGLSKAIDIIQGLTKNSPNESFDQYVPNSKFENLDD